MPDDPAEVLDALDLAEDAFGGFNTGRPEYEADLDPEDDDPPVIQLRKACRLLDACRTLRRNNGYHTGVIEMSFAAIERSLEFYALSASNDSVDDFQDHQRAYDRAVALSVLSENTADRLKTLYTRNRSAAYYRDTVATAEQAAAMFSLAVQLHGYVANFGQLSHECRCDEWIHPALLKSSADETPGLLGLGTDIPVVGSYSGLPRFPTEFCSIA